MPVSIRGKRFAFATVAIVAAALAYGLAFGGPPALASHGSPPRPAFLHEFAVPGSVVGQIADGLGSTWVSGVAPGSPFGTGNQIVGIPSVDTLPLKTYPVPFRVEDIVIAGGFVWGSGTELSGAPATHTARIVKIDTVTDVVTPIEVDVGYDMNDITVGADGAVWFTESNSTASQIGRVETTTGLVTTRFPLPAGVYPTELSAGPDGGLWLVERVGSTSNFTTKIGRFNTADNPGVIEREHDFGDVFVGSLINGPDSSLWFLESDLPGPITASITKLTPGVDPDPDTYTQYDVSDVDPFAIASIGGAIWFTTGLAGNVGSMMPDGTPGPLFCIGPAHPAWITGDPGGTTVAFTEQEEGVGRVPTAATGSPCPPPPVFVPGSGGIVPKKSVVDKTPAKVSLSGKATQRFTKKGVLVVTVRCNEDCRASGQASISTPGASKLFRSNRPSKIIYAGKSAKLTLKFKNKAVKTIRKFLKTKKTRKRLKARLTILVTDAAGNHSTGKRTVKLKR